MSSCGGCSDVAAQAGLPVSRCDLGQWRNGLGAGGLGVRTAGAEDAAGRRIGGARDIAGQQRAIFEALRRVGDRRRGEQCLCVGVARTVIQGFRRRITSYNVCYTKLLRPSLPQGTRNYITPGGYARIKDELDQLLRVERPHIVEVVHWAASNGDRSENGDYIYGKKRLREIDRRIRFLTKRLDLAEVVDPAARQENCEQVFFGATVTVCDEQGDEQRNNFV